MLKKVVAKPQRGARIGNIYGGLAHVWQGHLTWQAGRVAMDPDQFAEELRRQFEAIGLPVVGDPTALFDDPTEWKAECLIGALITDMKLDLWYPWAGYGNFNTGSGNGYVEIEWQVYERRSRSVQLRLTTEGSAHGVSITDVGPNEPLIQAFGAAAKNLLAEAKFVDLVAPRAQREPTSRRAPIAVALVKPPAKPASPEIVVDRARLSVLTLFAGDSQGSGFLISRDGYVLTNQHVIGEARSVTAKSVAGRDILGEVVRVDRVRDVALIKLEHDLYDALALGNSALTRSGTDVYAIGSPRTPELGQSVTRGVVSGFRVLDDLRYIQSDVAVSSGSSGGPLLTSDGLVVGIAVLKRTDAEGISFFVPIEDALEALAITDAATTQDTSAAGPEER
jgi:S1-C subfamily serine protease